MENDGRLGEGEWGEGRGERREGRRRRGEGKFYVSNAERTLRKKP